MSEGATKGLKGLIRAAGAGNDLAPDPYGAKGPRGLLRPVELLEPRFCNFIPPQIPNYMTLAGAGLHMARSCNWGFEVV